MKNRITKRFIMKTEAKHLNVENNKISMVCVCNGGEAYIIISYGIEGEQEEYPSCFDIPEGVGFRAKYSECKQFLLNVGYYPINKFVTQKFVNEYENGKTKVSAKVILEYFKVTSPEKAWEIRFEDGSLMEE